MNTIKKPGRLTKSPPVSLPEISDALEISFDCKVLQFWEARDRRMLPFTNFMRLVLINQVATASTAEETAGKLGIDHKTFSAWRSFLSSESVLQELLIEIERALQHSGSIGLVRLQKALKLQLLNPSMTSIPKLRSDAKMPSDEAFSKAVAWSVSTVLFQYASKLELPKNKTVAMAAKEIGDGLSWAYSCSPVRDVPAAWRKLIQSLQVVSTAKVEFQLLKITASSVEGFDVDNSVKRRLQELEKIVCAQTKDAIRFAQNYLHAIQQVAIDEDEWSEKSSAQYPVLPIPSEMSKVDAALMSQLNAFINEIASH